MESLEEELAQVRQRYRRIQRERDDFDDGASSSSYSVTR